MGMYRTSFQGLSQQSLRYLGRNSQAVQMLQKQLASGKTVSDMSDSPLEAMKILDLKTILNMDNQYKSNISTALSEVQVTDSAMTSAADLIQRAKELATQGASFGNDQNNMNAIATEVDQIITQMVQLGNTTVGGRYIFGGKQTQSAPFAAAGNNVTYAGNAPGVAWQRQIEVAENTTLTYNTNGESVFGKVTTTAVGPPPVFAAGSTGVLKTLMNLSLNLKAGSQSSVRTRLDELDTDLRTVLTEQTSLGSIRNRLENTQQLIDQRELTFSEQLNGMENINLPEVLTQLSAADNAFQMSLASTAKAIQPSLMQYLN
jgi:flagellar hook-associated protein 3 FlgL